ncbi:MAG: hypothetical protein KDA60_04735 [Planctomycetales bacterium]|nr:hypothetical protein [Planctomycetales bacterium]
MWRSLVMASGLSMCILGGECMFIDQIVVADSSSKQDQPSFASPDDFWNATVTAPAKKRVLVPPEWAPWGLMSFGVLSVLYAGTMPKSGGE